MFAMTKQTPEKPNPQADVFEAAIFSILGSESRSPGIGLILLGGMGVFLLAGLRGGVQEPTPIHYFALGFCFLLAITGIVLLLVQIRRNDNASPVESLALTSSVLEHAVSQLGKNSDILRRQTTQGFLLAGTVLALGVCLILAGSVGDMFGLTKQGSNLVTVAGVVVEVISGLGLYLFRETFRQLNVVSDRLHDP
jgi:hypothetical protein